MPAKLQNLVKYALLSSMKKTLKEPRQGNALLVFEPIVYLLNSLGFELWLRGFQSKILETAEARAATAPAAKGA
jgi:hypothetical protein